MAKSLRKENYMKNRNNKFISMFMLSTMFCAVMPFISNQNFAFASAGVIMDGDMTIEEGANPDIPLKDKIINAKRMKQQLNRTIFYSNSIKKKIDLNVEACKQKYDHYCGPATVQQTINYIKGYSCITQTEAADQLGTTKAGTDMTLISGVLNNNLSGVEYSMDKIGKQSNWRDKIITALESNKPVIIDINSNGISGWSYETPGHFLNISGYDGTKKVKKIKVTDPHNYHSGEKWYKEDLAYKVNKKHFRASMIS